MLADDSKLNNLTLHNLFLIFHHKGNNYLDILLGLDININAKY